MTYPQIIKELKAKKYSPIYLLHGNEPYYIDKFQDMLKKMF